MLYIIVPTNNNTVLYKFLTAQFSAVGIRLKIDKIGLNITYVKNYQVKYQAITTKLTSDNNSNNKCQFF